MSIMRKKLSVSFLLLLSAGMAVAEPVGVDEAMQVAYSFYRKQAGGAGAPAGFELTLAYTGGSRAGGAFQAAPSSADPAFYVFNKPGDGGFIIVSGESETADVLGYSDNGAFAYEEIPDNFRAWLDACEAAVAGIRSGAVAGVADTGSFRAGKHPAAVEPLLGGIMWDQADPYNLLCPEDTQNGGRSVTGCVATAMAQIMRYHKWPAKGKGTNSYTTETLGINMSVSFSRSVYDWEHMTEKYDSSSTEEERQAVALLMRDCGVSVSMDYTSRASGAQSSDVGIALPRYFNYDQNLQIYDREYFPEEVWLDMLRSEISAGRPVYYSGASIGGGHAFVCDGYDANGLFHFNWGWSGMSNGYFDVTILDPSSQGIGAGSGGYSFQQYIITGIQKPSQDSEPVELVCLSAPVKTETTETRKGEPFTISFGMRNRGLQEMMPRFGFALYQDGNMVEMLNSTEFSVGLTYNYGKDDLSLDVSVPSSASDGMYRIYPVYRNRNLGDWKIMNGKVGCQSYLDVKVEGETVKISSSSPAYAMSAEGVEMTSLYSGCSAKMKMNLTNSGDAEYVGILMINLVAEDNSNYTILAEGLDIKPGETYAFDKTFTVNAPEGEYTVVAYYDKNRDSYLYPLATVENVKVEKMVANSSLELAEDISVENDNLNAGDELVVNARVRSVGGPFYSKLIAYVYRNDTSDPVMSFYEDVFLEDGAEPTDVKLTSIANMEPGDYFINLWGYQNNEFVKPSGGSAVCAFKVLGNGVSEEHVGLEVNHDSGAGLLRVRCSEGIDAVTVYSLSGVPCMVVRAAGDESADLQTSSLSSGTYIVKVEMPGGCAVRKFVKK